MSTLRTHLTAPVLILGSATLSLYIVACLYLQPPFDTFGDAPGYLEAMRVLLGGEVPAHFTPNRLLTTFGSVGTVALLSGITGNYFASWYFVNTLYFFGLAFVSYALLRRLDLSETASILGALFIVGNYDVLSFGLNYLMDISGWFWFMCSLYFLVRYMESNARRDLWGAALAAGLGTLFKEYAFFAFAPLGLYLIYRHGRTPRVFLRNLIPCTLSLVPLLLVHLGVYLVTGYSYADWYGMNATVFGFGDWAWNAGRSFLVVLSFLIPLALLGIPALMARVRAGYDPKKLFLILTLIVPALSVFLWPIITERLVFLAVPLVTVLAAFAIDRYRYHWPWFGFVWLLYVLIALRTDGLILNTLYAL